MTFDASKEPDSEGIKDALALAVKSQTFADARRLKAFLNYIVQEWLAGRGHEIRAKLIASDVYGRKPEEGSEQEAIVRVDAGRLRRRLDTYYATEGRQDPVRIYVPSGAYVPRFELRALDGVNDETGKEAVENSSPSVMVLAVIAAICVGFGAGWALKPTLAVQTKEPAGEEASLAQGDLRLSVNQVSSASLLSLTFVEEANELIMPSIDPVRVRAGLLLCARAIDMSPESSHGYACKAFAEAFLAFINVDVAERADQLASAIEAAATGLRIEPTSAYAQMASAWVAFVAGDRDGAIKKAEAALNIGEQDAFLRSFYGMMLAFHGRSDQILANGVLSAKEPDGEVAYHPFIVAGARFMTNDYLGAIEAVDRAVALEGRTSALITAIYVAALENSNDKGTAEDFARNFSNSWQSPKFEASLSRYFSRQEDVRAILGPLEKVMARIEP